MALHSRKSGIGGGNIAQHAAERPLQHPKENFALLDWRQRCYLVWALHDEELFISRHHDAPPRFEDPLLSKGRRRMPQLGGKMLYSGWTRPANCLFSAR